MEYEYEYFLLMSEQMPHKFWKYMELGIEIAMKCAPHKGPAKWDLMFHLM